MNCLLVTGESIETALKLLSKLDKVQTPVAGNTDLERERRPLMVPFFALTPNQYVVVLFNPETK